MTMRLRLGRMPVIEKIIYPMKTGRYTPRVQHLCLTRAVSRVVQTPVQHRGAAVFCGGVSIIPMKSLIL